MKHCNLVVNVATSGKPGVPLCDNRQELVLAAARAISIVPADGESVAEPTANATNDHPAQELYGWLYPLGGALDCLLGWHNV